MKVIRGLHKFDKHRFQKPIVVAIGTFDGVHRAHQEIIRRAVQYARRRRGTSVIITFFPHPRSVASPGHAPQLLTGIEHRLRLIAELKPDVCVVVNFQKQFARLSAERFLADIVHKKLGAERIVVGEKFNFGRNRTGTIRDLVANGPRFGYEVEVMPALRGCGNIISSSAIRAHIEKGRLHRARCMLGRSYVMAGTVIPGDRRGRTLGFPTANLDPHQEMLPPDGVYAVRARLSGSTYAGMCSIGMQPTFLPRNNKPVIEVHLLDFTRNIYGRDIEIEFVRRLRGQKRYRTVRGLIAQMRRDEEHTRRTLPLHQKATGACPKYS